MMKLKHLESALSTMEGFREPDYNLEQYNTSPHLAAHMMYTAAQYGDIEDKSVCDLGCGPAMLGIASQVMGAASTVGFELDSSAIAVARDNIAEFEVEMDLVQCDVTHLPMGDCGPQFDTVVMNPPFGTRTFGIDMIFVEKALAISRHAVYSMHKSSTRDHIVKRAEKWGVDVKVLAQMRFEVPAMYKVRSYVVWSGQGGARIPVPDNGSGGHPSPFPFPFPISHPHPHV